MRYLRHKNMRDEQEASELKESEEKRSKLTARMVEGTIVQNALEMGGLSQFDIYGGQNFVGADEDYASLIMQKQSNIQQVSAVDQLADKTKRR